MLLNYLVTAWRRLRNQKAFYALNFIGLYISLVACVLIGLLIFYETSFDQRPGSQIAIYRVVNQFTSEKGKEYSAVTPYPLAPALRTAMAGGAVISQIHYEHDATVEPTPGHVLKELNILFADSVFPTLFPLTVREGSLDRALREPGFAVLTTSTARRYYGSDNPIGKRLKFSGLLDLQVAAVIDDAPANTHLPYNLLIPYRSMNKKIIGNFPLDQWTLSANGYVYVGLPLNTPVASTEHALADLVKKNLSATGDHHNTTHWVLQPLREIHYDNRYAARSSPSITVNVSDLYLIGAIGLFLMLAACINYTNLSTAMALKKAKEVGVRKTMGATRGQLIRQLLTETFLLTGLVILAAMGSVGFFLPPLNSFLDKNIPLHWLTPATGLFPFGIWVLVSLLSGMYPAAVLSGFNPVKALQARVSTPKASILYLRRGLVVFQFVTAQVLIICAVIVSKQMNFMNNLPLGFNKEQVVALDLPDAQEATGRSLKVQLEQIPGVSSVSLSLGAPISNNNVGTGFNRRDRYKTQQLNVAVKATDRNYLSTYGLDLLAGRWFDAGDEQAVANSVPDSLRKYAFVLNETATKSLGFAHPQDAIGQMVTFGFNDLSAPVIGVVKDYHVASLHDAVMPVLMVPMSFFYYSAGIRLAANYTPATLSAIEKVYRSIYPHEVYEAQFLDESIGTLYRQEKRTQGLFGLFTGMSILINVLGLIGLLSFMIEQKTREVGIRKVLGASMGSISYLLSKDFLRLSAIAFLIAAPVAAFFMNRWLQDFAYRTTMSWWVFAGGLVLTLVVTGVAISFQTIRAAVVNPMKSLRSE